MKKILISLGIIMTLMTSQVAFANNAVETFNDVYETTQYKYSIAWMYNNGVIQGYEDGSFKPLNCVNRAELLKMLYLVLGEDIIVSDSTAGSHYYDTYFSDTGTDQWYWPYVNHALKNSVVEGYPDGTFKPGQCVNRAEAIKIAVLGFELLNPNYDYPTFEDVDVNEWYAKYIYSAAEKDVVGQLHVYWEESNPLKRWFTPRDSMTRKEVAEMLYRMRRFTGEGPTINDLNYYVSTTSGVSFLMPGGWTVTSDVYYQTAGGVTADYPTIMIENSEGEIVVINQRMMVCEGEYSATCFELAEEYRIGAFDPSLDAMLLMNRILLTFRIPKEERVFDGCGKFSAYSDELWFDQMREKFYQQYPDSDDLNRYITGDGFEDTFGEGCKSVDGSQFIFIPSMSIDGCGKVFNYDIEHAELQQTDTELNYCANEFGVRVGDYVNFSGDRESGLYSCLETSGSLNYKDLTVNVSNSSCSSFGEYDPAVFENWITYTNQGTGFSIDYPAVWRLVESSNFVGFGPVEHPEDVQWGVNYYDDDNDPTLNELISQMGSQFPTTRTEVREEVIFNGLSATLATVTTSEYDDWISKQVFIVDGGHIWAISNGAIDVAEFDDFYQSFELL